VVEYALGMHTLPDSFREDLSAWFTGPDPQVAPPEVACALLQKAERLIASGADGTVERATWHAFLEATARPRFLASLPGREHRYRWAEAAFSLIRLADYTLLDMLEQRVKAHPDRPFLEEPTGDPSGSWSFEKVARRLQSIAGAFHDSHSEPRVAILAHNRVESACADLACLLYDIFVTPLSVHFNAPTLAWIFRTLRINIVVTDSEEHRLRLMESKKLSGLSFQILLLRPEEAAAEEGALLLEEQCAHLGAGDLQRLLTRRRKLGLDETATVMFTSGSTGVPKGICFTHYNLVTKRFARGAALPEVGERETLLCYLPLYHTFGRYLELLGMLYWGGTYVFAGNPSAETLLAQLKRVQPTGLIGIPLRWVQVRDRCLAIMAQAAEPEQAFRETVGERLRWGLSAAGYLDPKVFHFFQRHGVDLCSGFGMTEATGGITMTPPGEYSDNTVGIPLPGIRTRFTEQGELQISGPYVARYLDEAAAEPEPDGAAPAEYWLSTGDLFRLRPNGHLELVDRIKDIYKNNRGQTIAPRRVEQKFTDVPGIKRTFLVGDNRAYNVLLIVPEPEDPIIKASPATENVQEYFHQIVTAANQDLAPYERVINFAVLDRDFEVDRGELTPKGSYRRKIIEDHFHETISDLYRGHFVHLKAGELLVRIPNWFFRDLGILENDIVASREGLSNPRLGLALPVERRPDSGLTLIGNLEYRIDGDAVDLGLFARQPRLWIGNPSLIAFSPCKDGWDLPLRHVSPEVALPWRNPGGKVRLPLSASAPPALIDERIGKLNQEVTKALFGEDEQALRAVESLSAALSSSDDRFGDVIRRRLEALSRHPDLSVRCLAYRTLLLDEPVRDYGNVFPAFIQSGLPFLSRECIEAIARANMEQRRLEALRQRLHAYRTQLSWPASEATREQFLRLLELLFNAAEHHPEFFAPVREELASWALHKSDPILSGAARRYLSELIRLNHRQLEESAPDERAHSLSGRFCFDEGIPEPETERLGRILNTPGMLRHSVILASDDESFRLHDIASKGLWVSRVPSLHPDHRYRVSINTKTGKHFDLQLITLEHYDTEQLEETALWLLAVAGYPHGPSVFPRLGCLRLQQGVMTLAYVSDLTVWERVREFSSARAAGGCFPGARDWRKLYVRAMGAFFRAWRNSEFRIIPGIVSPSNVVVHEPDFRESSCILSITGWRPYEGPSSLIDALIRNFYHQTAAHYPRSKRHLKFAWIFDACVEALGVGRAREFLRQWAETAQGASQDEANWPDMIKRYLEALERHYYIHLPLQCAIDRYSEWEQATPHPSAEAREDTLKELQRLYRLDRFPTISRFTLYRHTYFANSSRNVQVAFDRLLQQLFQRPGVPVTQMVPLSDLQAALHSAEDRGVFSRMVFPRAEPSQDLEILAVGESGRKQVIVKSHIHDRRGRAYSVREPLEPNEIGQLYRLFFREDFPKTIHQEDCFLVAADDQEQIVGGVRYRIQDQDVVHLDGVVVAPPLKGGGIGTALLEDFCVRMASRGAKVVKTHFFLRQFCLPRGFRVDRRWGGLVRFLVPFPDAASES
jgi:long-chain acyl-CoA synthetase